MNQKNVKPRSASCLKQIRKIEMNLYSTYRHHIHFSFFPVCFSSGEAIIMCVCPQGADEPISCQRGTLPLLHGTSSWVDLPALFVPWSCPHFWNVQLSFHSPRKVIWICLNKSLNPTKNSKAKKVLVLVFSPFWQENWWKGLSIFWHIAIKDSQLSWHISLFLEYQREVNNHSILSSCIRWRKKKSLLGFKKAQSPNIGEQCQFWGHF